VRKPLNKEVAGRRGAPDTLGLAALPLPFRTLELAAVPPSVQVKMIARKLKNKMNGFFNTGYSEPTYNLA
jgi:hypothetical protein